MEEIIKYKNKDGVATALTTFSSTYLATALTTFSSTYLATALTTFSSTYLATALTEFSSTYFLVSALSNFIVKTTVKLKAGPL